jgi:hypothetical protein
VYLGTGYLHGNAIASFALYPVRVTQDAVAVSERMTLRVQAPFGEPGMRVVSRVRHRARGSAEIQERLRGLVDNPQDVSLAAPGSTGPDQQRGGFQPTSFPSLEGSPVDYVIITNDSLVDEFQVLADWKTA